MDRTLAITLTATVGGAVAMQAPINSHLGKSVGSFQAAFLSFAIGTVALLIIAAVAKGGLGGVRHATEVPWYYLVGGLLGVAYVSTVLVTVRTLGAGGVTAATIAGQLTLAVIIDQLGILHVAQRSITLSRVVGIALLAVGVFLIVRN